MRHLVIRTLFRLHLSRLATRLMSARELEDMITTTLAAENAEEV